MRCGVIIPWLVALASAAAADESNAVRFDGNDYVSLAALAEIVDGKTQLTEWARGVRVEAGGRWWEFANGGDRLKLSSGEMMQLALPLLVIDGGHYVPLRECAPAFGYRVEEGEVLRVIYADKHVAIRPRTIDLTYRRHQVAGLERRHDPISLTGRVIGRQSLHDRVDVSCLGQGTNLLIRRRVVVDSQAYLLATECSPELRSYLIAEEELKDKSKTATLEGTAWARYADWFREQAADERGLRFGDRQKLEETVSVTVDLCWSLRRFEADFFRSLPQLARQRGHDLHAAVFVSGRWLQQHPTEMEALIELDRQPGVKLTWGLHSWAHPKSGGFMNDFSPRQLREDTFQLERSLLQWGIVPTVYYRFPGLIHDRERLDEVLRLDLFSIDCESWIALLGGSHPYAHPVTDGSIILVHGNGNEPRGIGRMNDWLVDHPQWQTQPLHRCFVPSGEPAKSSEQDCD